jgi:hypothetical protein
MRPDGSAKSFGTDLKHQALQETAGLFLFEAMNRIPQQQTRHCG